VRVRLSAYGGFLVRLPAALVARRRIRRAATVPDTELTGWFVDPGGAQPAGRPDPSA
jgi:hypothetical protein